jgi:CRISPR-associated protein (TIGR02710 family)
MTENQTETIALVATVGGSPQPIATALKALRPSIVWFIVSDGSNGTPSSRNQVEDREIIYDAASGLRGPGLRHAEGCPDASCVQVLAVPPDDPDRVLSMCASWLDQLARQHPGHRIVADYTGGTKSMTGGLLMAALGKAGTEVQFMAGERRDLALVESGTEAPRRMPSDYVLATREFERIEALVSQHEYASAFVLSTALKKRAETSPQFTPVFRRRVNDTTDLLSILALWDSFNHVEAFQKADRLVQQRTAAGKALQGLGLHAPLKSLGEGSRDHPTWQRCADLWLNTERTAHRQKYDDAIARLYRLTEAVVQSQLWLAHKVPNPPPLELVPESIRGQTRPMQHRSGESTYQSVGLGFERSVELLLHFDPRDPVAGAIQSASRGNRLTPDWTSMRNNSILAHGYRVLKREDWNTASNWVQVNLGRFWKQAMAPQLPRSLECLKT